jgi:DNA/RNA-binding domain of Phe-tRNA-synthetase-like protein
MQKIEISERIKILIPKIQLGCVYADVVYEGYNKPLWQKIDEESNRISKISAVEIKKIPQIQSTREAYKILGKEPSRYRPSAEALMRRIIQGKGMYKISNLVDTINFLSIKTAYSIGGYDAKKITGKIILDKANSQIEYQAIGRGKLNIENLPVLFDDLGAFGCPTSDSVRTMITKKTKKILLIFFDFAGNEELTKTLDYATKILENFCTGRNIETDIIK